MEFNLKLTVLLFGIVCTGLTAGLCFTWTNAITTGLSKVDDITFLKSFQAINRTILNPTFFIVFLSPVFTLFINAFLHRNSNSTSFRLFLVAAILFFVGVGLVTVFKNVPLNEILDKAALENLSEVDLKKLRIQFENSWKQWHLVRTITSFIAFVLLLIGLTINK